MSKSVLWLTLPGPLPREALINLVLYPKRHSIDPRIALKHGVTVEFV